MPFSKEVLLATGILAGCFGLVVVSNFVEPAGDEREPTSLAGGHQPPDSPGDQPPGPPSDLDDLDEGEIAFDLSEGTGLSEPGGLADNGAGDQVSLAPADDDALADLDAADDAEPTTRRRNPYGDALDQLAAGEDSSRGERDRGERSPREPTREREAARATPAGGGTYVVEEGDLLSTISFRHYGTHHRWQDIQRANPDIDPNRLIVGTELVIPKLDDVVTAEAHGRRSGDGYVVKRGDSFYTIARDQLGDASRYREIMQLNDVDPQQLEVGMKLTLPGGAAAAGRSGTAPPRLVQEAPRDLPSGARWHVVERGDILGTISQRYYGTARRWREIAQANDIADDTSLIVGQKLVIPGAAGREPVQRGAPPTLENRAGDGEPRRGPGTWHVVERGDALSSISQNYYGTATRWQEIRDANPGINPQKLVVGAKLWIPGAQATRREPVGEFRRRPVTRTDLSEPELEDLPPLDAIDSDSPLDLVD